MFTLFGRRHFVLNQLALTQFRPDQMKLIVRDFGCLISADQLELLLQILINIHFGMVFFHFLDTFISITCSLSKQPEQWIFFAWKKRSRDREEEKKTFTINE